MKRVKHLVLNTVSVSGKEAGAVFLLPGIRKKLPVAGSVGAEAHQINELLFVEEYNIIV